MSLEVAFMGALARDAEARTSKAGKPYVRFTARVGDGDAAQWVCVMAFDEKAVEVADKFVKAARVYVEGRLSLDKWTARDGSQRQSLSVMSWHCRLAEIGRAKAKRSRKPASGREVAAASIYAPGNGQADPDLNDEIGF